MDITSVSRSDLTSISKTSSSGGDLKRSGIVYLDHNATTPVLPEVRLAMEEFYFDNFANTSSSHAAGARAKAAVESARAAMAECLGASPQEIVFTSGASEALNLAIFGSPCFTASDLSGRVAVATAVEHHAVLHPLEALKKRGLRLIFVNPRRDGVVRPEDLEAALEGVERVDLAAFMMVNNETGAIMPVEKLSAIVRERGAKVLCDAVQGFGKVRFTVDSAGADMIALSAHKFYGPKGAGLLYLRRGTRLSPLILGGGHESGLRSGTVNTGAVAGMAKAAGMAMAGFESRRAHCEALRERLRSFEVKFAEAGLSIAYNSDRASSVASTVNISFRDMAAETVVETLSARGIMVSAGSACNSKGGAKVSHVIDAAGAPLEYAMGAIRVSFGVYNEPSDVDAFAGAMIDLARRDRN